jgi:hypothetical protein
VFQRAALKRLGVSSVLQRPSVDAVEGRRHRAPGVACSSSSQDCSISEEFKDIRDNVSDLASDTIDDVEPVLRHVTSAQWPSGESRLQMAGHGLVVRHWP